MSTMLTQKATAPRPQENMSSEKIKTWRIKVARDQAKNTMGQAKKRCSPFTDPLADKTV